MFHNIDTQAAGNDHLQDVLNEVQKANNDINGKIEKAKIDSNKLISDASYQIMVVESGKESADIEKNLAYLTEKLNNSIVNSEEYTKISKNINKLEEKKNELNAKLEKRDSALKEELEQLELLNPGDAKQAAKIDDQISKIEDSFSKKDEKVNQILDNLEMNLDKLSDKLINDTNERAGKAKEFAKKNGYTVICELIPVQIGSKELLIDPIRVSW
jgi:chromosome segregation ATPase